MNQLLPAERAPRSDPPRPAHVWRRSGRLQDHCGATGCEAYRVALMYEFRRKILTVSWLKPITCEPESPAVTFSDRTADGPLHGECARVCNIPAALYCGDTRSGRPKKMGPLGEASRRPPSRGGESRSPCSRNHPKRDRISRHERHMAGEIRFPVSWRHFLIQRQLGCWDGLFVYVNPEIGCHSQRTSGRKAGLANRRPSGSRDSYR